MKEALFALRDALFLAMCLTVVYGALQALFGGGVQ